VPARELVEAGLDAGRDLTAVARAASPAGVGRIDDQRAPAAACGLQRGVEAGVAGADDEHIDFDGQWLVVQTTVKCHRGALSHQYDCSFASA
jgi:hypothetical protein